MVSYDITAIGHHVGAFTAFCCEATRQMTNGVNVLEVEEAVDICVELASRIKPPAKGLTQGEADLAAIRQMCRV